MKVQYYTAKGTKTKEASLSKALTDKINEDLMSQAFHVYRDRSHFGESTTQTRSDVSRTTAKWYKQKGTGRARHGARSAPIFVGGGKAHGAKGMKRILKLSRNLKTKALLSAINWKVSEKQLAVVSNTKTIKKTKEASQLLEKMAKDHKANKVTLVLSKESLNSRLFFRNISFCEIEYVDNLNAYTVMLGGFIVFEEEALKKMENNIKTK